MTSGVAREPPEEERRRGCGCGGGGGGRAQEAAVAAAGGTGRPEGGRRGRKLRQLHGPGVLRDTALASARQRPNNEALEANLGQPQWEANFFS